MVKRRDIAGNVEEEDNYLVNVEVLLGVPQVAADDEQDHSGPGSQQLPDLLYLVVHLTATVGPG